MKNESDSKNFRKLVRRRMNKTGESYAVARAQLVKKRIEIADHGPVLLGCGRLIPHREIKTKKNADTAQIFRTIFGPDWRPPTERCRDCHEWISFDGFCACNAHEQPMEITRRVTISPAGSSVTSEDGSDSPLRTQLQAWIDLPEIPPTSGEGCYLAAKVGCLVASAEDAEKTGLYVAEPFGPEMIVLGTVTIEGQDGGWSLYRLPAELSLWAYEQVQEAFEGNSKYPAFLALEATEEGYEVRVSTLRA